MATFNGTPNADSLVGGLESDKLFGFSGNDTLVGGAGNDELFGGAGNDILEGGTGNDDLFGGDGVDTLRGGASDDQLFGDAGNDNLDGGIGDDKIYTGDGDDYVEGGDGNDSISKYLKNGSSSLFGGSGNDTIWGGNENDIIDGNEGDDSWLEGFDGNDTIRGGSGNDKLYGSDGNDTLDGGVGNDELYGGAGNDSLDGGNSNDELYGGAGNDSLIGGDGNDSLSGGAGNDLIYAGAGDDKINYLDESGNDTVYGGDGNDFASFTSVIGDKIFYGEGGNDTFFGGAGNDSIDGGNGNDELYGGAGNDSLIGGDGNDYFSDTGGNNFYDAGSGNDTIFGDTGQDTILGGIGDDSINGWDGDDSISGGDGADTLSGGIGNDSIHGGNGNDELFGSDGNDTLDDGVANDELYGGDGNDSLIGGAGNDELYGSDGNDTLDGGVGNDELFGGAGNDTYHVRSTSQYIYDSAGTDTAFVYANFVKIPSTIENVQYRDGAQALPNWISALIPDTGAGLRFSDLLGNTKTFFYTFPTTIPAHHAADAEDKLNWTAFTSTQQARVESALGYISTVIGVRFVKSTDSTALNTITFANNNQTGSAGYAYYPNESLVGNDLFLDNSGNSDNAFLMDGNYSALTLIHELGHSFGLRHPFATADAYGGIAEPPYLSSAEDKTAWTVMSYTDSSSEYFLRFSPLDIAALQYMYGPSTTARTSNDTYSINAFGSNFIWDGGGIDELSAASANTGCTIYLTPGYWGCVGTSKASSITSSGQITINFGTVIENLTGSQYADALYGNEAGNSINGGAGNDVIEGWAGNDTLFGGLGDDRIDGGDGVDVASFNGLRANYEVSWSSTSSSFTVRSNVDGTDTLVGIETLRFTDISVSASSFQDTVPPAISLSASKANLRVNEVALLTFTLSEASTTFISSDVTVTGGTLSNFSGSGITYTALFTPTPNTTTSGVIRVASGSFTDAAGNVNADGSDANNTVTITVNTLPPINSLLGTSFDDLILATSAMDRIDGGSGTDTVVWGSSSINYQLRPTATGWQVADKTATNVIDTLINVEKLQFSDRVVIVESKSHASYSNLPVELYQFFITAFNAAPGVTYMDQLAEAYNYGLSVKEIVDIFTTKSQFTSVYAPTLSNQDLATELVNNIIKTSATAEARTSAVTDIKAALDIGWTVGRVIFQVFGNLAKMPLTDPFYGNTTKQFNNQITVAKYYTETLNQGTTDLETLRDVVQSVTSSTDVSTDAAIAQLIGVALLTGGNAQMLA